MSSRHTQVSQRRRFFVNLFVAATVLTNLLLFAAVNSSGQGEPVPRASQSKSGRRRAEQQQEPRYDARHSPPAAATAREGTDELSRITRALQLAADANVAREQTPLQALRTAVAAVEVTRHPVQEAEEALRRALDQIGGVPLPGFQPRISSDSKWLAMAAKTDGHVQLLSLIQPILREVALERDGPSRKAAQFGFSPAGRWLLALEEGATLKGWPLLGPTAGSLPMRIVLPNIESFEVSPDDRWLLVIDREKNSFFCDLSRDNLVPVALEKPSSGPLGSHRFTSDGKFLVAVQLRKEQSNEFTYRSREPLDVWPETAPVMLYDLNSPRPASTYLQLATFGPEDFRNVFVSPNSKWLAMAPYRYIEPLQLWQLSSEDIEATSFVLPTHTREPQVTFSSDGRWCVNYSDSAQRWMTLEAKRPAYEFAYLWDLAAPNPVASAIEVAQKKCIAAFSPDSNLLAVARPNETMFLHLRGDQQRSPTVHSHSQYSPDFAEFSPDGRWFVQHYREATDAMLFHTATEEALKREPLLIPTRASSNAYWQAKFSHDSSLLIGYGESPVLDVWSLNDNGMPTQTVLRGHDEVVTNVLISKDDRWLISEDYAGFCRLWDLSLSEPDHMWHVLHGDRTSIELLELLQNDGWVLSLGRHSGMKLWRFDPELFTYRMVPTQSSASPNQDVEYEWHPAGPSVHNDRWLIIREGKRSGYQISVVDLKSQQTPVRRHVVWTDPAGGRDHDVYLSENQLVIVANDELLVFDLSQPRGFDAPLVFKIPTNGVGKAAIGYSGRWLIAGPESRYDVQPGNVRMWDLHSPAPQQSSVELRENRFQLSEDGRWLAICDNAQTQMLDLAAEDPFSTPLPPNVRRYAGVQGDSSGEGNVFWAWDQNRSVSVIYDMNVDDARRVAPITVPFPVEFVSPDRRWAVGDTEYFDLRNRRLEKSVTIDRRKGIVQFASNLKWMVKKSRLDKGHNEAELDWASNPRYSNLLVSLAPSSDLEVRLPATSHHSQNVQFSPTNAHIAVLDRSGDLRVWSLDSPTVVERGVLLGHDVTTFAWNQKANVIVAAFEDGSIRFFNVDVRDLLPFAKAVGNAVPPEAGKDMWLNSPASYRIPILRTDAQQAQLPRRATDRRTENEFNVQQLPFVADDQADPDIAVVRAEVPRVAVPVVPRRVAKGWGGAWSKDARLISVNSPRGIDILDAQTFEAIHTIPNAYGACWSPHEERKLAFIRGDFVAVGDFSSGSYVEVASDPKREMLQALDQKPNRGLIWWSKSPDILHVMADRHGAGGNAYSVDAKTLSGVEDDWWAKSSSLRYWGYHTMGSPLSPDGKMVVVSRGSTFRIMSLDIDPIPERNIPLMELALPEEVLGLQSLDELVTAWSPDQKFLALTSLGNGYPSGLIVVKLQGEKNHVVKLLDGNLTLPQWSPDGQHILFDDRSKNAVYVVPFRKEDLALPTEK